VRNDGKLTHELVAFRTDLGQGDLPMAGDRVNEEAKAVTHIDPEAEDVQPGASKTLTLELEPGRYVIICNLAGHYASGMHQALTVR
jgi:uncharacterized cupredoxin-like copper-binding protein